jgi:hypothetical protein
MESKMSNRKISAIIAAAASVLILISVFSGAILTKSKRRRTISIGYKKAEMCKRSRCESVSIGKFEKDLAGFLDVIFIFQLIIGFGGIGVAARRFMADEDIESQKKVDKYHLSFMIGAIISMLILIGWFMALKNLHGLNRLKLEAGFGFHIGIFGYGTAIGSFIFMKKKDSPPTPQAPGANIDPPPPAPGTNDIPPAPPA